MIGNILEYLELTAARVPERIAFSDERASLTFGTLLQLSQKIGSAIAERVPVRSAVAVIMDNRDVRCIPVLLGVLYAGCCYAPLDGAMPVDRLECVLEQLQPALIIHDARMDAAVEKLGEGYPLLSCDALADVQTDAARLEAIRAETSVYDLMSILFTSGSTGVPKGVAQNHYAYIAYTEATIEKYGFDENTVFGNQSPFFYANSIIDIFPTLALGAKTYILPAKCLTFPKTLIEQLNAAQVTELTMTPSSYVKVANAGVLESACLPHLKYIVLSGEAAHGPTLRKWLAAAPKADVWNFYGSTEVFSVAVWKIDRAFSDDEILPVGVPYPPVHILFVDEDGREVPRGERGMMLISNPWLSSGYYRDTARTADAFLVDPMRRGYFERFYRTGDIGRINSEGQLIVLGRQDSQIKRHGYRMEIGEVEYALRAIEGWQDGCVLYDREREKLCCFWEGALSSAEIQRALKKQLPKYALPDTYIHLEAMPHTATMKIDRQALMRMLEDA